MYFAQHFTGGLHSFGYVENTVAVCISCVQILDYLSVCSVCVCICIDTLLGDDGRAGKM